MTRQKTISSLSIAAIALLAVAVPSFAQAQSDLDAQRSVAAEASEQTNVSSTELIAATNVRATPAIADVERTPVADTTRTASSLRLSASLFKAHNLTSPMSSHFVSPQVIYSHPGDPSARKQFRADADEPATGRKVSFVPSRGPKAPDKVIF